MIYNLETKCIPFTIETYSLALLTLVFCIIGFMYLDCNFKFYLLIEGLFVHPFQVNCDSDTYSEFMPLEPSFLIMVICAKSDQCPASLQCLNNTQQHSLTTC